MKSLIVVLAAFAIATSVLASGTSAAISKATQQAIMDKLAAMQCQMDPDDIETADNGGYELDDVICVGGRQFDIELDAGLNEVGRREE